MKKSKAILLTILFVTFLGVLIPKVYIKDAYQLSQDDHDTIMFNVYHQLDNPIELVLIQKIAVDNKKDETVYTSAYTLWGLKYATVETNFSGNSKVTWRRWFGK